MSDNNGSKSDLFSGELDPDIAELMGIDEKPSAPAPDFQELFNEAPATTASAPDVSDISREHFHAVSRFEQDPVPYFQDKDYYKKALSGEGDVSQRVHSLLSKFLNTEDPKERSVYRGKLISAYWNLVENIGKKICSGLPQPKVLTLRYGALLPTLLSKEQRSMISRIVFDNNTGEPVHYVDEWLNMVARGAVGTSATDETKTITRRKEQKVNTKLDRVKGQRDFQLSVLARKFSDQEKLENQLKDLARLIADHGIRSDLPGGLRDIYTPQQRQYLSTIGTLVKDLQRLDHELVKTFEHFEENEAEFRKLSENAEGMESYQVNNDALQTELSTVRQMAKMCVGRQGNHFPIAMKQYFRDNIRDICTRENIIMQMAAVENLDPVIFLRTFKQQTNRIVPHVLIIPSYGERGICWEPFEKYNRATSRGRIAVPLFPKEHKTAIIAALGDLRWQVAKEKAQHYWMEEGLTGRYYQWFSDRRLRGDVREYFINDYILWLTKESEGTQKLDREVRGIMWRYCPFPQELRESLKNRGYVYNELYKRDINRSMSDGY
ncbi:hypothetical protein [Marispirochaeta sp.]|jgi:hypothetical protein|uniref:hypothetical protein n=1 Tax=Marispirochaeta sp. TaxID=2038653 RepID=UPI0029C769D3|nr:hypothetical protein [Marispirochaeta sp.]